MNKCTCIPATIYRIEGGMFILPRRESFCSGFGYMYDSSSWEFIYAVCVYIMNGLPYCNYKS